MNLRTKVITTIIAMICSLSVSASGIAAILVQFSVEVNNATALAIGEVQGDLYGERYGANNQDLVLRKLYENGSGVNTQEMQVYTEDVSFSDGSSEIVYLMKFVLSSDAENGVVVKLTNGSLSNSVTYTATYQVATGQPEPNWNTAEHMAVGQSYVVSKESPYLWLRAKLVINRNTYSRDTSATWSFSYNFEGLSVQG